MNTVERCDRGHPTREAREGEVMLTCGCVLDLTNPATVALADAGCVDLSGFSVSDDGRTLRVDG